LDEESSGRAFRIWHDPAPRTIEAAILCTLAYADLFDYPMTSAEIRRHLVGWKADPHDVQSALDHDTLGHHVVRSGEYYTLSGREPLVEIRLERARAAAAAWPWAIRYGQAIARLPFIHLVAVTGALAVDNAGPADNIDCFIVTAPDRLWLSRAVTIQFVVKPALRRGITLCPNYLLSELALADFDHDLFTAHEIVQMVPIAGQETYRRLCSLNTWVSRYLPNAFGQPRPLPRQAREPNAIFPLAERILRTPIGGWAERWEMKRKIDRFTRRAHRNSEVLMSADRCKAHFERHARLVREAFFSRLASFDDVQLT